jgi:hypothetical protein
MRRACALTAAFASLLAAQSTINGTVIEQGTRTGIPGVQVRFFSADRGAHEAITDEAGRFSIVGLPAGSYYIGAEKAGYSRPETSDAEGAARPMMRVSGNGTEQLTLELMRYGSLLGRVLNADSQPAAGARVMLRPIRPGVDSVMTREDGSFAFTNLRPGSYTVVARPKAVASAAANGQPGDVATYYPGVSDPSLAEAIPVQPGAEVSGIDIRIQRVPLYRITGSILNDVGEPAGGVTVRLQHKVASTARSTRTSTGNFVSRVPGPNGATITFYSPNPADDIEATGESVVTSKDGRFSFEVPAGDWVIHGETPWERVGAGDDRQFIADGAVTVSKGDESGVTLQLSTTFDLTITAEIEDQHAGREFVPPLILRPVKPGSPSMFGQPADAEPGKPAGIKFEHALAGSYTVITAGLAGADGLYLAAFTVGGQDALAQPFYASAVMAGGKAVFRKARGGIQGTIDGGRQATIIAIPSGGPGTEAIASVEAAKDTPFALPGLRPGNYDVIAFVRINPAQLADTGFVDALARIGRRVTIDDGFVSISLNVNAWPDSSR